MADQIEEVKGKVDVVELVGEYVQLKKAGRNYKGLCPFHGEKTPSFMVNPELQIFKCFGCAEGGDVFGFVQKMEGVEFGEALRILAKRAGVTLTSYKPTQAEENREILYEINQIASEYYHYLLVKHKTGIPAKEYLEKRGISEEVMERYKLGYAPDGWEYLKQFLVGKKKFKEEDLERAGLSVPGRRYDRFRNRVMFPLSNHRGAVVGFAGRVMPGADEKAGGKYVNTPETEIYHKGDLLYGLDLNKTEIKTEGWAVVVEGEVDSIASWMGGVKNVVAIKGSALTEKQVQLMKRYADTLVLALDADLAGDAAARRGIDIAHKAGMIIKVVEGQSAEINPKGYKDPGDWAVADPAGWKRAVEKAVPIYDFYMDSAIARYGLDPIGKSKIGRELLPIWVKIDDAILKSHYVQRLAGKLGVSEDDIKTQMAKVRVEGPTTQPAAFTSVAPKVHSGREMVEEYLVGLAVRNEVLSRLFDPALKSFIVTPFWVKVVNELETLSGEAAARVKQLPAEYREKVENLFLAGGEEKDWEKDWSKTVRKLEELDIREKLSDLSSRVDDPEVAVQWKKLAARLTELTRG